MEKKFIKEEKEKLIINKYKQMQEENRDIQWVQEIWYWKWFMDEF